MCTTCNGIGHLKNECPELILPKMIDLPTTTNKWTDILSLLCRQITGTIIIIILFRNNSFIKNKKN